MDNGHLIDIDKDMAGAGNFVGNYSNSTIFR